MRISQSTYQIIFTVILLFMLSFPKISLSDEDPKAVKKTYKEITKTDITKYSNINYNEILIFGISFNMSINDALQKTEDHPAIFFKVDPFNNTRYYLYDTSVVNGRNIPLAYFIWDENGKTLKEVIIYAGFKKYLVGDSKKLLGLDVINKNSELVKTFMGYPVKKEITLEIPAIGLKTFCYFYPNHNFKIFRNITDQSTSISLGICRELVYK